MTYMPDTRYQTGSFSFPLDVRHEFWDSQWECLDAPHIVPAGACEGVVIRLGRKVGKVVEQMCSTR